MTKKRTLSIVERMNESFYDPTIALDVEHFADEQLDERAKKEKEATTTDKVIDWSRRNLPTSVKDLAGDFAKWRSTANRRKTRRNERGATKAIKTYDKILQDFPAQPHIDDPEIRAARDARRQYFDSSDKASKYRKKMRWWQDVHRKMTELRREGFNDFEIALVLNEEFGVTAEDIGQLVEDIGTDQIGGVHWKGAKGARRWIVDNMLRDTADRLWQEGHDPEEIAQFMVEEYDADPEMIAEFLSGPRRWASGRLKASAEKQGHISAAQRHLADYGEELEKTGNRTPFVRKATAFHKKNAERAGRKARWRGAMARVLDPDA